MWPEAFVAFRGQGGTHQAMLQQHKMKTTFRCPRWALWAISVAWCTTGVAKVSAQDDSLITIKESNGQAIADDNPGNAGPTVAQTLPREAPDRTPAVKRTQEDGLLDFEDQQSLVGNNTSHEATVTLTDDTPVDGGKFAAKTVASVTAGAAQYFGTGFQLPPTDLSRVSAISLWIKTDIESGFNLQIHSGSSGNSGVSIFPFSTVGFRGKWKEVTAPMDRFRKPPWSKSKADLTKIRKIQVTAFSSGPYDGKYIIIDSVRRKSALDRRDMMQDRGESSVTSKLAGANEILKQRRANLRESVILKRGEPVEMFDGKTLEGWTATPRVYIPRSDRFADIPSDQLYEAVIAHYKNSDGQTNRVSDRERVENRGVWTVEDGVILGAQQSGSIAGSYLMSDKQYGDFELTLEANPDYPIDTGIMVRAHKLGSVGFQVLVDHRPNGTIGGVYGNRVGDFFAYPFIFDADEEPLNRIANLRPGDPSALRFRGGQFQTDAAASLEDFLKVWKANDWNEIKVRCTGRLPLIETWINGVEIAKIDTETLADVVPGYDPEAIFQRIGREGHIGLEVHDSPIRDRWAPGAKCRWRNVRIRELVVGAEDRAPGRDGK